MHYKRQILHSLPKLKNLLSKQLPGLLLGWMISPLPYIILSFFSKFSHKNLSYICLVLTILLMVSLASFLILRSQIEYLEIFIKRNHPNEDLKALKEYEKAFDEALKE
jgi:hypothetical protein